jgi:hypothetical protein
MWKHKSEAVVNLESSKNRILRKKTLLKQSQYRTVSTDRIQRYLTPAEIPKFTVETLFHLSHEAHNTLNSTKSSRRTDRYLVRPRTASIASSRTSNTSRNLKNLKTFHISKQNLYTPLYRTFDSNTPKSKNLKLETDTLLPTSSCSSAEFSPLELRRSFLKLRHYNSIASLKSAISSTSLAPGSFQSTPRLRPSLVHNN